MVQGNSLHSYVYFSLLQTLGLTFLIDYTTKEYISKLVSNSLLTHGDITLLCLDCIRYHLHLKKGCAAGGIILSAPFLGYSVDYWTDHAIDCPEDKPAKRAAVAVLADTPLMNAVGMVLHEETGDFISFLQPKQVSITLSPTFTIMPLTD